MLRNLAHAGADWDGDRFVDLIVNQQRGCLWFSYVAAAAISTGMWAIVCVQRGAAGLAAVFVSAGWRCLLGFAYGLSGGSVNALRRRQRSVLVLFLVFTCSFLWAATQSCGRVLGEDSRQVCPHDVGLGVLRFSGGHGATLRGLRSCCISCRVSRVGDDVSVASRGAAEAMYFASAFSGFLASRILKTLVVAHFPWSCET